MKGATRNRFRHPPRRYALTRSRRREEADVEERVKSRLSSASSLRWLRSSAWPRPLPYVSGDGTTHYVGSLDPNGFHDGGVRLVTSAATVCGVAFLPLFKGRGNPPPECRVSCPHISSVRKGFTKG
jgi:hypothetical protein